MNERLDRIARMCAVTVSREYGSGGGEVARRLARRLNWELVDHNIIVQVAKELNITEEEAEVRDERSDSLASHILMSMQAIYPMPLAGQAGSTFLEGRIYHQALTRVVEGAVATGHVVVVGRGSQALLAERRDVLHVRIVAPLDLRIAYVMRREGLNKDDARSRIEMKDHDRVRYLQTQYHLHPNDPELYDLVLNTGILDLDSVVEMIELALQRKAARLDIPADKLGPGAGLEPYPGKVEDFRPSK